MKNEELSVRVLGRVLSVEQVAMVSGAGTGDDENEEGDIVFTGDAIDCTPSIDNGD